MSEREGIETLRRLQSRSRGPAGSDDVSMGAAIDAVTVRPPSLALSERLKKRFGLGGDPKKRLLLYMRLEKLFLVHGDIVWLLCSEAAAQAVGTRDPGRYFCRSIILKLRDNKILSGGEGFEL